MLTRIKGSFIARSGDTAVRLLNKGNEPAADKAAADAAHVGKRPDNLSSNATLACPMKLLLPKFFRDTDAFCSGLQVLRIFLLGRT